MNARYLHVRLISPTGHERPLGKVAAPRKHEHRLLLATNYAASFWQDTATAIEPGSEFGHDIVIRNEATKERLIFSA